jgi:hypothetical protein
MYGLPGLLQYTGTHPHVVTMADEETVVVHTHDFIKMFLQAQQTMLCTTSASTLSHIGMFTHIVPQFSLF